MSLGSAVLARLRQVEGRVSRLLTRARVVLVDEEEQPTQRVQLDIYGDDDVEDEIEHVQPYGVSFNAGTLEDLQAIALALGGSRSATLAISVHSPSTRPTDAGDGEGGMYNANGWMVYLAADGVLHLGTKEGEAPIPRDDHLQAELVRVQGELDALRSDIQSVVSAISGGVPSPQDGGGALLASIVGGLAGVPAATIADPGETACSNVRGT